MGEFLARFWVKAAFVVLLGVLFWVFWPANSADTPSDEAELANGSAEASSDDAAVEPGDNAGLARELGDGAVAAPDLVQTDEETAGSTQSDTSVMVLWILAAAMTVLLIGFLFHTSPRRRARDASRVV